MYVAAIGIDRYRSWGRLENAVNDARGTLAAFEKLGFEPVCEPLLDEAATRDALYQLVNADLPARLHEEDSLVLFFAGHGHAVPNAHGHGPRAGAGYLIPVEGRPRESGPASWLHLGGWLDDVARLPARHVLVILDACHSGVALNPMLRYRGESSPLTVAMEAMEAIRARRSRRVFASALGDQRALDSGPMPRHSLFTGCLIEALSGGFLHRKGLSPARGIEIWTDVQTRVIRFPGSCQSPDFGVLHDHDDGDLIIDLHAARRASPGTSGHGKPGWRPTRPPTPPPRASIGLSYHPSLGPRRQPLAPAAGPSLGAGAGRAASSRSARTRGSAAAARVEGERASSPFVEALERHESERIRGGAVLTVIPADSPSALADFAGWAGGRGALTLVTDGAGIDEAIAELLAQVPWLRCLAMARRSLAAAAQLDLDAVDAALDARAGQELRAWIDGVAGTDAQVRVSGWLLSAIRDPAARGLDPATAPVQGGALLAALCELAAPIAVLVHHAAPTTPWLERALAVAHEITDYLPGHAVAVGAPAALVTRVLEGKRQSASTMMARQGLIPAAPRRRRSGEGARERAAQALHAALAQDARTAGVFAQGARVATRDGRPDVAVDLVAESARLAVMIDGWYHRAEPEGYRRDRADDARLGRAGYFVMRFAAEDIGARTAFVVNEIALGLAGRRASGLRGGPIW